MLNLKADTRRKLLVEIQTEIHLKKKVYGALMPTALTPKEEL